MLPSNRLGRPRMFGQERGACADLRSSRPMCLFSWSATVLSFSTATFELAIFLGGTGSFFRNSRKARTFFGGLATSSSRLEWSHLSSPGTQRRRTGKHVIVLGRSPRPRAWYFFYVTAGIFDPELSLSQLHPR